MNIFYGFFFLAILGFFLFEPELVLASTQNAVDTWFSFVLPALLPFFILSSLCQTYGGIRILGALLRPITQGLFSLPGEVAFVVTTGYSTGAPVSSTIVASLRRDRIIDKKIGDFLLAFTANVSPLFIFSVVAVSFLYRSDLGIFLAITHYGSNLILGTIFLITTKLPKPTNSATLKEEIMALSHRKEMPIGQGLATAIFQGLKTIGLIGGLIIVFFIILDIMHFFAIDAILAHALAAVGVNPEVTISLMQGITEITAGTKCAAAMDVSIAIKFSVISAILAFGGISTLCQIATQIKGTDLSLKFYFCYKVVQGVIAYILSTFMPIKEQALTLPYTVTAQINEYFFLFWPALILVILLIVTRLIRHLQHRKLKSQKSFYR